MMKDPGPPAKLTILVKKKISRELYLAPFKIWGTTKVTRHFPDWFVRRFGHMKA